MRRTRRRSKYSNKKIDFLSFDFQILAKNFSRKRKKSSLVFGESEKSRYICIAINAGELSSVGSERLPYKQRVGGSNPSAPTRLSESYSFVALFFMPVFEVFYTFRSSLCKQKNTHESQRGRHLLPFQTAQKRRISHHAPYHKIQTAQISFTGPLRTRRPLGLHPESSETQLSQQRAYRTPDRCQNHGV